MWLLKNLKAGMSQKQSRIINLLPLPTKMSFWAYKLAIVIDAYMENVFCCDLEKWGTNNAL